MTTGILISTACPNAPARSAAQAGQAARESHFRTLRRTLAAAVLATLLPPHVLAVDATWLAGDGNYTTAANWDTNPVVPLNGGLTYDSFITGSGNTIVYDTPLAGSVDSLNLGVGVEFIVDEASSAFTATNTFANDASLIAEDQGSLTLGGGNLDRSNLIARKGFLGSGGATVTTAVTSWTGATGFAIIRQFSADGAGSLLDLSSLTTVVRSGGSTNSHLNINATDGGRVDLSGIAAFTDNASGTNGRVSITANGTNSVVDLVNVTAITDADLEVRDGGTITGQLNTLGGRSELIVRSTGVIDLSQLADADNASLIAEHGATLDLATASIDQADLIAHKGFLGSGGATVTTAVTSWTGATGFAITRQFSADGAGSLLDLSSLTTVVRSGGSTNSHLNINATDGGRVDLSGIAAFTDNASGTNGRVSITANGTNSVVDLVNVTAITDADLEVRDGGTITGLLNTLGGRSELIVRSTGVIDLSQLADADNASLIAEHGATLDLATASIDQADLIARKGFLGSGGATVTTAVTSWTGATGFAITRQFSADGAGSLLDLSSLTTVVRSGGSTNSHLNINATDGGRVDLSGIAAFTDNASGTNGRVRITASGANSAVDLGQLTTLAAADITVDDTASVDVGQLTTFSGGTITLESTATDAADLHVAASFTLGSGGIVEVAGSTAALVVGPGLPAGAADGSMTVAAGGSLFGNGSIVGTLINAGLVGPGSSPGALSVTGDFTQLATATLEIEIGGDVAGTSFDLLAISGLATVAGTVEVNLWDAFVPTLGSSYVFLTAAAGIDGLFDSVACANCGAAGVEFELFHGANFVSLTAVAAPIPLPAAGWLLGSGLMTLVWRRRS